MLRLGVLACILVVDLPRPVACIKIPGLGLDPVKIVEQVLATCLVAFILTVLYVYRRRVVYLLTGDDRLHIVYQDVVWFVGFKCIGLCDGEWTRCISNPYARCCNPSWHNVNLKKAFAQWLGILPKGLEIRNVVAGDLPFDENRGDFYVVIECGSNPPKTSSICSSNPRIVHWPEVFKLRVRDSVWEFNLTMTIMELGVFGHREIATVSLPAYKIFRRFLANPPPDCAIGNGMVRMRFQLDVIDQAQLNHFTPSWIMVEFGLAQELTYSGRARYSIIGPEETSVDTKETYTKTRSQERASEAFKSKEFKLNDPLHDRRGRPVKNEPEDMSEDVKAQQKWLSCQRYCFCLFFFAIIIASILFRVYMSRCWEDYEVVHSAISYGYNYTDFPLSGEATKKVREFQRDDRPTEDDIVNTCERSPYKPLVFEHFSHEHLKLILNGKSIRCYSWTCEALLFTRRNKAFTIVIATILTFVYCCRLFGPRNLCDALTRDDRRGDLEDIAPASFS